MDKQDLKKILKPLIKECIREVIMEEGFAKILHETVQEKPQPIKTKQEIKKPQLQENSTASANRKKLLEEIGKSGYMATKFDPFQGTTALRESQASNADPAVGPMANIDPADPGVDISKLMNGNKKVWNALVGGKAK